MGALKKIFLIDKICLQLKHNEDYGIVLVSRGSSVSQQRSNSLDGSRRSSSSNTLDTLVVKLSVTLYFLNLEPVVIVIRQMNIIYFVKQNNFI